jgi:hypothetical protein
MPLLTELVIFSNDELHRCRAYGAERLAAFTDR